MPIRVEYFEKLLWVMTHFWKNIMGHNTFFEIFGFLEMLDNNKTPHFRAFPAKTLDSIFDKSPKPLF